MKYIFWIMLLALMLVVCCSGCSQGSKKDFYDKSGPWHTYISPSEYKKMTIKVNRYGEKYDGNKQTTTAPVLIPYPVEKKVDRPNDKDLKDIQKTIETPDGTTTTQSGKTWKKIIHIRKNGDGKTVVIIRNDPAD